MTVTPVAPGAASLVQGAAPERSAGSGDAFAGLLGAPGDRGPASTRLPEAALPRGRGGSHLRPELQGPHVTRPARDVELAPENRVDGEPATAPLTAPEEAARADADVPVTAPLDGSGAGEPAAGPEQAPVEEPTAAQVLAAAQLLATAPVLAAVPAVGTPTVVPAEGTVTAEATADGAPVTLGAALLGAAGGQSGQLVPGQLQLADLAAAGTATMIAGAADPTLQTAADGTALPAGMTPAGTELLPALDGAAAGALLEAGLEALAPEQAPLAPAAPGTPATTPEPTVGLAPELPAPAVPGGLEAAAAAGPAPEAAAAATAALAPETASAPAAEPAPLAPTVPSLAVSAALGGPSPTAVPAPATTAGSGVTGQVFPEISRMVTRGDGTHRLTMKLNPEALGDVRVVLTVRQGEVQVRMTGAAAAQAALAQGAPELHRLLEKAGASTTQVVVGDRTSTLTADPEDRSGTRGQDGSEGWGGTQDRAGQRTDDRTAGMRNGSTSARDGDHDRTQPRSSTDPAATTGGGVRRSLASVDVTM